MPMAQPVRPGPSIGLGESKVLRLSESERIGTIGKSPARSPNGAVRLEGGSLVQGFVVKISWGMVLLTLGRETGPAQARAPLR